MAYRGPTNKELAFTGYGNKLNIKGDSMFTNDLDGIRWVAARLGDDRRHEWFR